MRQALFDLLRCGFGHVECAVEDDQALEYQETELTYKPGDRETTEAFVARLLADPPWRRGDRVSIIAKRDRLDLIRIRRFVARDDVIMREDGETPEAFAIRLEQIARGLRAAARAA
jgi:hypothetical protein